MSTVRSAIQTVFLLTIIVSVGTAPAIATTWTPDTGNGSSPTWDRTDGGPSSSDIVHSFASRNGAGNGNSDNSGNANNGNSGNGEDSDDDSDKDSDDDSDEDSDDDSDEDSDDDSDKDDDTDDSAEDSEENNGNNGQSDTAGENRNSGKSGENGKSGQNRNSGKSGENGKSEQNGDSGKSGENRNNGDNKKSGESGESENNGSNSKSGENRNNGDNEKSDGSSSESGENGNNGNDGKSTDTRSNSSEREGPDGEADNDSPRRDESEVAVSVNRTEQQSGKSVANATVTPPSANSTITLNFTGAASENATGSGESNESATGERSDVELDRLEIGVEERTSVTVNVTTGSEATTDAPAFEPEDENGTADIGYIQVDHSISDENISGANFTFTVTEQELNRTGADREDIVLYRYHNDSWTELPTELRNESERRLTYRARSPGFSSFAVGAKKAVFEIEDARLTVERLYVGNETAIRARIKNTGGADGTYDVQLLLRQQVVDERQLTIAANGTRLAVFEREFTEPGNYTLLVNNFTAGNVSVLRIEQSDSQTNETVPDRPPVEMSTSAAVAATTTGERRSETTRWTARLGFGVLVALVAVVLVGRYERSR